MAKINNHAVNVRRNNEIVLTFHPIVSVMPQDNTRVVVRVDMDEEEPVCIRVVDPKQGEKYYAPKKGFKRDFELETGSVTVRVFNDRAAVDIVVERDFEGVYVYYEFIY